MTGLPTLTLYPEHAELFRLLIRSIETRGWSTSYRGRIGLHAGKRDPDSAAAQRDPLSRAAMAAIPHGDPLTFGAMVATAELVDVVPIVEATWELAEADPFPCVVAAASDLYPLTLYHPSNPEGLVAHGISVDDQRPYGDFTPDVGRFAWLLDDIKPTTERCPACWGEGVGAVCPSSDGERGCDGSGRCDPIPVRGKQRLWRWTP